jgi:hypothetical protein
MNSFSWLGLYKARTELVTVFCSIQTDHSQYSSADIIVAVKCEKKINFVYAIRIVAEECRRKGVCGIRNGGLSVMRVGELK